MLETIADSCKHVFDVIISGSNFYHGNILNKDKFLKFESIFESNCELNYMEFSVYYWLRLTYLL